MSDKLRFQGRLMLNVDLNDSGKSSTLTVSISGDYGFGSAGNPDAALVFAAIDKALVERTPVTLVIDFTRMNYRWGDAIAFVFHKYRRLNPMFLLPASQAEPWQGLLTITWPMWADCVGKSIRFV